MQDKADSRARIDADRRECRDLEGRLRAEKEASDEGHRARRECDGRKVRTLTLGIVSSMAKSTPPIGVLNVAAIPAPAPAATRMMRSPGAIRTICPSVDPNYEPIWMIAPSRPTAAPLPMAIAEASDFTSATTFARPVAKISEFRLLFATMRRFGHRCGRADRFSRCIPGIASPEALLCPLDRKCQKIIGRDWVGAKPMIERVAKSLLDEPARFRTGESALGLALKLRLSQED